ncbi:MAG TPA: sigma-54 dependent transcriptional regulator [Terriglobales bacterium]|nr:sigma-54 dependent transcriptional regulator [Terriglobales bacterium]
MTSYPMPANYADRVLVASPSPAVRQRVLESLRSPARRFEQASGGAEAMVHLESGFWQVLFLDRCLPDLDAEELSQTVRQRFPGIEVVLLDAPSGAAPEVAEEKNNLIPEMWPVASENNKNNKKDDRVEASPASGAAQTRLEAPLPGMIGNSRVMQPVYHLARLLAARNTTVLITGPTGCGKEVVARAIHQLSPRARHTFAVVNCAAIPETLLEAELFGYARGAFTGAMQSYAGRIQTAQGGTLFLDEIGEMPLSLQPKLLRFLEQKELQRLGSAEVVRVDARIISATNAHLLTLVREGKFREDLYYRLSAFPIEIPPLRDRTEDVRQLALHFLEKYVSRPPAPELSAEALELLKTQPWGGNIRELQNVIERALILAEGEVVIRPEHLWFSDASFRGSR